MSALSEKEAPAPTDLPEEQPEKTARPTATGRPIDSAYTDIGGGDAEERFAVPAYVRYLLVLLAGLAIGGWVVHKHDHAPVVIASVNGQVIDKDTFFHRLQLASGPAVVRQMMAEDLKLQFAKKLGVAPTKAQIDARYNEASSRPGFEDYLTAHGLSQRDYRRGIELDLAELNVMTKGIAVTDADVREYYRENIDKHNPQAQFYMPETSQVEVVVTRSQEKAQAAAEELERYVPFDVVAREYSVDTAGANGGVLPPLQRGRTKFNNMPGLENAIFGLKIGEQTGPVEYGGQWWIIRCMDKAPETTLPFSAVRDDCVMGAKLKKAVPMRGKEVQDEYAQFEKQSQLQAFWPQYQAAVSPQ